MNIVNTAAGTESPANGNSGDRSSVAPRVLRWLGAAFLLQAIASAISGLALAPVDLLASNAPDDMAATMADIAANEWRLRASIVGEMVTAAGIVALGVLMFTVLRRYGQNLAMVAMGLYLVESAVLAVREVFVYGLWWTSQEAAAGAGQDLVTQAKLLYEAQNFAYSLHTLIFAAGAVIFYSLFARSRILPLPLIGLGVFAASLALVSQVLVLLGVEVPLYFFLPNLPFELGVGVWLLLSGRHR